MWNPATGAFTVMASIATYRGYHSTAVLLPDAVVLTLPVPVTVYSYGVGTGPTSKI